MNQPVSLRFLEIVAQAEQAGKWPSRSGTNPAHQNSVAPSTAHDLLWKVLRRSVQSSKK